MPFIGMKRVHPLVHGWSAGCSEWRFGTEGFQQPVANSPQSPAASAVAVRPLRRWESHPVACGEARPVPGPAGAPWRVGIAPAGFSQSQVGAEQPGTTSNSRGGHSSLGVFLI